MNQTPSVRPRHLRRAGWICLLSLCGASVLFLGPLPVMSDAPQEVGPSTTAPAPSRDDRERPAPRERHDSPREPREGSPPPTTQERDDALEFFRAHVKSRMRLFEQLPEGRPTKTRLLQMMVDRYRRLQRIKAEDPEMYDLMVQQMVIQDEAGDLMYQQRMRNGDADAQAALETQMRDKVRELINVSLQERQKRVERLEKMLEEQKSRLEQDLANPEKLVEQHLAQMKADADEVRRLRGALRGTGGTGGGMGGPQRTPGSDRPNPSR